MERSHGYSVVGCLLVRVAEQVAAGHQPTGLRHAVADFVLAIHRAYVREVAVLPDAVRARLPFIAGGSFAVAAIGLSDLHLLATRDDLGSVGASPIELADRLGEIEWRVRFYDVTVLPALGHLDATAGVDEVRQTLGIAASLYHLVLHPGATMAVHGAEHIGTGLAYSHLAAERDYAAMRAAAPDSIALITELQSVALSGLPHAQRLIAASLAPDDDEVSALCSDATTDPVQLRRAVLRALRAGNRAP